MKTNFYAAEWDSPITKLLLVSTDVGLCRIEFGSWDEHESDINKWTERWWGESAFFHEPSKLKPVVHQLEQYFSGQRTEFQIELDVRGTDFQKKVWDALTSIPFGETRSYGDIAKQIGSEKAVRAVGGANNKNPLSIIVPCHRVIGANGGLVGYGGGLHIKTQLLALEKSNV